jgi:hypothetical protein
MTRAEKFEEVFGFSISKTADDPCSIIDENVCINSKECKKCPLYHFWEKKWKEVKND